ncbi:hypothetical protein [Streptomyces sp. NPDC088554]|uniref:hypothetical protein n=1 Tax=Streptomyces sp. NPDC088554 TaxID=3365865 RepID=UPI0038066E80
MASADSSSALPTYAHPHAKPGYGKRSAPGQTPRGEADFVHLRPREAAIAGYIDRLPEGAAIGYKPLAANIAAYGQQACAKALRFLSDAGHLRLVKEHLRVEDNSFRWVTRTYFSRTVRDDAWWRTFVASLRGVDVTERERQRERERERQRQRAERERAAREPGEPGEFGEPGEASDGWGEREVREALERAIAGPGASVPNEPVPVAASAAPDAPVAGERSDAYRVLAGLSRTEPLMTLSAAECSALEGLAAEWLARGATADHLTRALTTGLPQPLHSPGAIARKRLETKMPPEPISPPPAYADEVWMVCISCEADERTTRIIRGVCAECREDMETYEAVDDPDSPVGANGVVPGFVPEMFRAGPAARPEGGVDVAARAAEVRAAGGLRTWVNRT